MHHCSSGAVVRQLLSFRGFLNFVQSPGLSSVNALKRSASARAEKSFLFALPSTRRLILRIRRNVKSNKNFTGGDFATESCYDLTRSSVRTEGLRAIGGGKMAGTRDRGSSRNSINFQFRRERENKFRRFLLSFTACRR